ncbi:uncharacterized protein LOC143191255 [Rhynchophorus ferrugineus]
MTTEDNGNIGGILKPTSSSNEDLSEYTDADESISAPTEFLAEFLSAVMLKDYVTALKYCKLILQYEPNNATAKEFYPLILEKLKQNLILNNSNPEDGSSNDSEDDESEGNSSSSESDSSASDDSSEPQEEAEEEEEEIDQGAGDKQSKGSSEGDATTGSYSSLEDDEAETDQLAALAAKYQNDNVNLGNGNKICSTHLASAFSLQKDKSITDNYSSKQQGNTLQPQQSYFMTSSDSESPTEPCQTVAMLRARVVPNNV